MFSTQPHRRLVVTGLGIFGVLLLLGGVAVSQKSGDDPAGRIDGSPARLSPIQGSMAATPETPQGALDRLRGVVPLVKTALVDDNGALTLTASAPTLEAPGSVEPQWQAMILAGALSDQLAANGAPPLHSVDVVVESPTGERLDLGGGLGNVVHDQGFVSLSDNVLKEQFSRGAKSLGFSLLSFTSMSPSGDSIPRVTLEAPATKGTTDKLASADTWMTLFGNDPKAFEGNFLKIQDPTGSLLYVSGSASRAGMSVGWVRPDLVPEAWQRHGPDVTRTSEK